MSQFTLKMSNLLYVNWLQTNNIENIHTVHEIAFPSTF